MGVRVVSVVERTGRGTEYFVLRSEIFQLSFEALVIGQEGGGMSFEVVEFNFEVFDVTFFAFPKSALTCRGQQ